MRETVSVEILHRSTSDGDEYRTVDVEITVDADQVAKYLVRKALRNKNHISTAMYGGVYATALNLAEYGKMRLVKRQG